MQRFYKKVTFLPEEKNNEVIVGQCIHILHGVCRRHKINDIGVSFPCWRISTIGDQVTFVSLSRRHLEYLLNQNYFFQMEKMGYFKISDTLPVTSNPSEDVIFIRNQAIDNTFPGAMSRDIKRGEKRALMRGEVYQVSQKTIHHEINHYHTIPIYSKNKNFRLNIQVIKPSNPISGVFTSYGLSNKSDKQCSVPVI